MLRTFSSMLVPNVRRRGAASRPSRSGARDGRSLHYRPGALGKERVRSPARARERPRGDLHRDRRRGPRMRSGERALRVTCATGPHHGARSRRRACRTGAARALSRTRSGKRACSWTRSEPGWPRASRRSIDLLEIDYSVLESQLDAEAAQFVDAMLASPVGRHRGQRTDRLGRRPGCCLGATLSRRDGPDGAAPCEARATASTSSSQDTRSTCARSACRSASAPNEAMTKRSSSSRSSARSWC